MTRDEVFLGALSAVDRTACARWLRAQGLGQAKPEVQEAARERWRTSPILAGSPELAELSRAVLSASAGPPAGDATPIRATCWRGKFDVGDPDRCARCARTRADHVMGECEPFEGQRPGTPVDSTLGEFVAWLRERAAVVAPKGTGVVCCPTVNRDGRRVNESTVAMTAVNLDCDARGDWERLLGELRALGIAHIAYQSGGCKPGVPKWHVLIPLSRHFDTSTPSKVEDWKHAYNVCRVVFGSLAGLRGEGFDPTIETPCSPVFVTERRAESDPPREVVWAPGASLDLDALVSLLPRPREDAPALSPRESSEADPLDDARLEEVVAALCEPISRYLSDRRDMYLALPGALLDRGVVADDVLTICEEVSRRCPGDPSYTRAEVAQRHREHVHCAETTIARFERDGTYTRIGTLAARWPDVARAIDVVLPDLDQAEQDARWREAEARRRASTEAHPSQGSQARYLTPVSTSAPRSSTVEPAALRKHLKAVARRKRGSKLRDDQILAAILDALVDRQDLVPRVEGSDEAVADSRGRVVDRSLAIARAAGAAAYKLSSAARSVDVKFEDIEDIFRPSLFEMLRPGEQLSTWLAYAGREFDRALRRKADADEADEAARRGAGDRLLAALDATEDK